MSTNTSIVNSIKVWIFPTLVSVLSLMIWHDVRSIQDDVKALMAQSNIDKTNITNVEKRVSNLEQLVFFSKEQRTASNKNKPDSMLSHIYAMLRDDEEENKLLNNY